MPISCFIFSLCNVNLFAFQFFSHCIRMQIPILTGVRNEPENHQNDSAFLLKNVLFEASFP